MPKTSIERMLAERFGSPLINDNVLLESVTCQSCGHMNEDAEPAMCQSCGMSMNEVAPPGDEKLVKTLKKQKGVDNPWALAWSIHNKNKR